MNQENIRNFSIIAHIDHGKSTLADRLLEETGTVEERKMKEQVLDGMELERERGITIKMTPARMQYKHQGEEYALNLIDTPGHIDFSYEVSRALKAVEGVVLLVDATQGVQAQTFTTLNLAQELDLTIIPAVSKVDSPRADTQKIKKELAALLGCDVEDVLGTSGKTGEGVEVLLEAIINRIPAPEITDTSSSDLRGLVFDFEYSNHQGVILYTRIFDGSVAADDNLELAVAEESFRAREVGLFSPEPVAVEHLNAGEIGYIVTGIKSPGIASVGDTLRSKGSDKEELPGYQDPSPVVWASIFPEDGDDFGTLKNALERLRLSDSSLSFSQESSGVLGRGFRCGFLGMLHLEIITERLRREFGVDLVVTTPSISYEVTTEDGTTETIYAPSRFPDNHEIEKVREPWISAQLITPGEYISEIMQLLHERSAEIGDTEMLSDGRSNFSIRMPLREMMRNFFDDIKRVSSGYASFSYEIEDELKEADVVRLDILVTEEVIPAFSRIVAEHRAQQDGREAVERLYELLPRQLYKQKIQARIKGDIVASKTLSALKKDAAAGLYGGDISRKKKLREKQKQGRKKMQRRATADIPQEVFLKMMRGN